jgi:hypothetical protein
MTEDIMPPQLLERLQPEHVSPLVVFLASEACTDTGHVYSVGGGYLARVATVEGPGTTFDGVPSADDIADRWDDINRMPLGEGVGEFANLFEQTGRIITALGITFD